MVILVDRHPTNTMAGIQHVEGDKRSVIFRVHIKDLAANCPDEFVPLNFLLLLFDESCSSKQIHIVKHITHA